MHHNDAVSPPAGQDAGALYSAFCVLTFSMWGSIHRDVHRGPHH